MVELGMHTDNWRVLSGNFQIAVETAVKYQLSHIEFGVIHGQYFIAAMGYDPSISLQSNPRALRRYLDEKGLRVSQIDGSSERVQGERRPITEGKDVGQLVGVTTGRRQMGHAESVDRPAERQVFPYPGRACRYAGPPASVSEPLSVLTV